MKQLLKDTAALGAVSAFIAAIHSWSTGSSAISRIFASVATTATDHVSAWADSLTVLQACALLYIIWVGASFFAFAVEALSDRPRTILVSTLMFGSFGTVVAGVSIIVLAGLRA